MTGLHTLLEEAAAHADTSGDTFVDVTGDLRRGHRALRRRRTRWAAAGITGGLAVAGAAGYTEVQRHHDTRTVARPADGGTVPAPVQTDYFDVPTPPSGWHVVGDRPQYLIIGRDGSPADMDTFVGQVVVMLSDGSDHYDNGAAVRFDGRTFYVNTVNDDSTILTVRASDGNWLQLEYPPHAFDVHPMVEFLSGVSLKPGAEAARG